MTSYFQRFTYLRWHEEVCVLCLPNFNHAGHLSQNLERKSKDINIQTIVQTDQQQILALTVVRQKNR